ncbi:MAG: DNA translocase FtsK [Chloroherpetonaceae bacterium]|nr:DNA translocase FtsK [Chloroherpetonaceae bacterium]
MPTSERESSSVSQSKSKRKAKQAKLAFLSALSARQSELLGAALMLLSLLLLIALVAYSPDDDSVIENVSLFEIFTEVGRLAASKVRNPLGFLGAKLSGALVCTVLGYPTAILVLAVGFWGWSLFRRRAPDKALTVTIYAVLFSTLLASLFGLTHFSFSQVMSGAIGRFIATVLSTSVGTFGAWVILLALLGITLVLCIDLDLQKTTDRLLYLFRNKASEAQMRFKEWHKARAAMRQAQQAAESSEAGAECDRAASTAESSPITDTEAPAPTPHLSDALSQLSVPMSTSSAQFASETAASTEHTSAASVALPSSTSDLPLIVKNTSEPMPSLSETSPQHSAPTALSLEPPVLREESCADTSLPLGDILRESDKEAFEASAVKTSTNWATALLTQSDDSIDDILQDYLGQKRGSLASPNDATDPAFTHHSAAPLEPEITLIQAPEEVPANLDDRPLEVETKEKFTYQFPSIDLLLDPEPEQDPVSLEELEEHKRRLLEKLRIYKIEITRIEATVGPRVTLFELELAPDVKVSRIVALQDDLAMAMAARGIRIIAPIPGKNAVGVEIPNHKPRIVRIKSLLNSEKFKHSKFKLPIALGKTIANEIFIDDLCKMPHLLVAGATGSGKSVGINTLLTSLLYFCSPEQVKFLLIDPKRVELFPYQCLKDHFLVKFQDLEEQIITDTSKAVYALKSVEKEMDNRYERLAKAGVRNLQAYNEKFPQEALPFIVVVIDELADMMITAGREVEEPIARLAQLARAVGIHLVVATQRPSVDVITGVIKANFPARIAYQVASKVDSRTILDTVGAEQLLGNGDMLYLPASQPKPIRLQNALVTTEEVEALTAFIASQKGPSMAYLLPAPDMKASGNGKSQVGWDDDDEESTGELDKMFAEAARLVVRHQQGSVSLLQRRLKLGFGRAARIMDQLEQYGIVGPPDGSKPRQVLIQSEAELDARLEKLA